MSGYVTNAMVNNTEIYDGSSWTEGANVSTSRGLAGSAGTTSAAMLIAGHTTGAVNTVEDWTGESVTAGTVTSS